MLFEMSYCIFLNMHLGLLLIACVDMLLSSLRFLYDCPTQCSSMYVKKTLYFTFFYSRKNYFADCTFITNHSVPILSKK